MLVIAGFESQIAARAALASIARAASESGATLGGAALARLGFEDAIHVDRVSGLNLPGHVLRALDDVVAGEPGHPTLSLGETALVVALDSVQEPDRLASAVDRALGADHAALWLTDGVAACNRSRRGRQTRPIESQGSVGRASMMVVAPPCSCRTAERAVARDSHGSLPPRLPGSDRSAAVTREHKGDASRARGPAHCERVAQSA